MLASFLLSLREGLEAALIIGIVLAALRKIGHQSLSISIWQGAFFAIITSILAGLALSWIGAEFEGRTEQIYEGTMMVVAAMLLTWMIIWMRRQTANLKKELEAGVEQASTGQAKPWALFWLSYLAVGREAIELVLFLTAAQLATGKIQTMLGAALGLGVAIGLGWAFVASSRRMNLRLFFSTTNILLVLFAAGLLAHGVHEFTEAGIIPAGVEQVWNMNAFLDESQPFGQLLTALFGYNGNPSLTEILAYGAYFLFAFVLWKKFSPTPRFQSAH
jgi:high-affinity iron transporter